MHEEEALFKREQETVIRFDGTFNSVLIKMSLECARSNDLLACNCCEKLCFVRKSVGRKQTSGITLAAGPIKCDVSFHFCSCSFVILIDSSCCAKSKHNNNNSYFFVHIQLCYKMVIFHLALTYRRIQTNNKEVVVAIWLSQKVKLRNSIVCQLVII